jgi:hypothetical protein
LVYGRINDVYLAYLSDGDPLINQPLEKSIQINNFNGEIGYSFVYTNDQRILTGYSWEYTHELNRDEKQTIQTSEKGKIMGFGRLGAERYNNAIDGYDTAIGNVFNRVSGFYVSGNGSYNTLKLIGSSNARSEFNGTVDYSRTYTDDDSIGTGEFKKVEINISDEKPVSLYNKFEVINYAEIVQPAGISTLGQRNLSLNLIGARTTVYTGYLNKALTEAAAFVPDANLDTYLADLNFSFAPQDNNFNLNARWVFHTGLVSDIGMY